MAGEAILPDNFAVQGLPSEADLVAAFAATPGYQAMAKAEADKQARIAAYKAANPGASDFAARYYGGTDEDRARIAAMYPGTFGNLHKSMYYSGAAPQEGQSILNYMLANNGQMPETKVKEGPGLGQALLNAAMLAAAGFGVGTIGNALAAGAAGAGAGAGAGTAAGTAAGGTAAGGTAAGLTAAAAPATSLAGTTLAANAIPATVAGLVPTSTALGAGSAAANMAAALGAGATGAGAAGGLTAAGAPVTSLAGETLAANAIPSTVAGLTPTSVALGPGSAAANMAAALGGGATSALPGAADSGTLVDELVVTGAKKAAETGIDPLLTSLAGEVLVNQAIPNNVEGLNPSGPNVDTSSPNWSTTPDWKYRALDWVKANPIEAAKLGLTLVGGIGGVASDGGTGGGGGIPPGFAAAGTPGSLSDIFRAKLPAPSGPFADLSARNVAMTPEQWKTYGQRSEQSFFNNVPQRPSGILDTSRRAPPMPLPEPEPGFAVSRSPTSAVNPLGVASSTPTDNTGPTFTGAIDPYSSDDFNQAPTNPTPFRAAMDDLEFNRRNAPGIGWMSAEEDMWRRARENPFVSTNPASGVPVAKTDSSVRSTPLPAPSAEPEKFAKGGFAVRGIGSGRDDKIPARLSDGEYVIDAETVALLGDGSSDAGAKRLDAFRANIRKHKGKKLARGEFSVNAKKPEAYLKGGRA